MDWRTPFLVLVFVTEAWSLMCLQCKGISQPRHCKTVDRCYLGELCGVERVRNTFGELVYNEGCIAEPTCQNVSSKPQGTDECTECCRHDLCNAQGCGEPGYPQNRGPVCYSCPVQSDPDKCHDIAFCKPGEVCKHIVLGEFGDTVYVSECSSLHECRQGMQQGVANAGRDLTNGGGQYDIPVVRRSLTEHVCSGCCIQDLCNEGCNDTTQTADCDQDEMSNEVGHEGTELLGYKKDKDRKDMPSLTDTTVAFYAYLSSGIVTMNNYQQLVFDEIVFNNGNGYNKLTGAFTAPRSGTYIFSFQYENWLDDFSQRAHLYVEGNIMASSIIHPDDKSEQAGNTAVVHLEEGWVVYVKVQGGRVYGTSLERFTTFTGALLG